MTSPAISVDNIAPWKISQKIAFRTCLLFFVQYFLLGSNEIFADKPYLYGYYIRPFYQLIPWIGQHILHLSYPITVFPDGSSADTTFDYVLILFMIVMAIVGTFIWSLLDRDRSNYQRLNYWLTLALRYYLGLTMLSFGLAKVYKIQFPFPSPRTLIEPLGSYSPMHLAWTFFGYSGAYTRITGWAEVISGILLIYRRTYRLGTLFFLVVIFNVSCVNYFYDVCLKTTSTVLFFMGIYLLVPDLNRLNRFFILNQPVEPVSHWTPRFQKAWINGSLTFVKFALTIAVIVNCLWVIFTEAIPYYADDRPQTYFNGIFEVQNFVRNKDTLPPLLTDTIRWSRLILSESSPASSPASSSPPSYGAVRQMNDKGKTYYFRRDSIAQTLTFYSAADTTKKYLFNYTHAGKDDLSLKGNWKGDSLAIRLKKTDPNEFQLVNRGFHWINEGPYQR